MIHSLFPSFVYEAALGARGTSRLNTDLKKECLRLSEVDLPGRKWSDANYPGGYTSYGSMDELHRFSSTFRDLQKQLDRHVARFVRALEMDIDPKDLQMQTCWVNLMPAGVIHSMHIHPLSAISGTYYVQTPPQGGALKFEDPRMAGFMASPPRKAKASRDQQRFVSFRPKAGHLLLFESWMRHEVPQNRGNQLRISISFNYDWVSR